MGLKLTNKKGQSYEIVGLIRKKGKKPLAVVRFDSTGNTYQKDYQHAARGRVGDKPTTETSNTGYLVHGVGRSFKGAWSKFPREYRKWEGMLARCYGNNQLNSYIGVKVCERWLCFRNFLDDIKLIPGYELFLTRSCHLDKDLRDPSAKIYSLETCSFVDAKTNLTAGTCSSSDKTRKAVRHIETGHIFKSQTEAAKAQNTTSATVSLHCLGRVKLPKWEFV